MRAAISIPTAGLGVTLLLSGCGGSATAPRLSPAPTSSTSANTLSCRLPIAPSSYAPGQFAGFISLPAGTYSADSGSALTYDSASGRTRTVQTPVLYGDSSGLSYDRAKQRWLPVTPAQVLPDGSAYAYTREASPTQFRNEIHVVTVDSGVDRMIYNQDAYHAIAYQPEGVYLDYHLNMTDASTGLWLLDPATASLKPFPAGRQVTWAAIVGRAAWSYSVDGSRFGSSSFARLDLATGLLTTWFRVDSPAPPGQPGARSVRVLGFRDGNPLVVAYVFGGASEVWLLTAPNQATHLTGYTVPDFIPPSVIADTRGIWLGGADGIYLYSSSGFRRVASVPPPGPNNWTIAASCG